MSDAPATALPEDLVPPGSIVRMVPLDRLCLDHGVQARVAMNAETVRHYAAVLAEPPGEGQPLPELPPGVAFDDGKKCWLASGFHRHHGYRLAGREAMPCRVVYGTRRDAVLFSARCNRTHGLQRSNADKRRAVTALLRDPEWSAWRDAAIARHCGVSHTFVGNLRDELCPREPAPDEQATSEEDTAPDAVVAETELAAGEEGREVAAEERQANGTVPPMAIPPLPEADGEHAEGEEPPPQFVAEELPQAVVGVALPTMSPAELDQEIGSGDLTQSEVILGVPMSPADLEAEIARTVRKLYLLVAMARADLSEVLARHRPQSAAAAG